MQVHHLERTLKRLKLSGILATLEERLEQAQRQQLGYVEFLRLLLEDKAAPRGQKALALRVSRARFEEVKTLADFDFKANPQIPAAQIRDATVWQRISPGAGGVGLRRGVARQGGVRPPPARRNLAKIGVVAPRSAVNCQTRVRQPRPGPTEHLASGCRWSTASALPLVKPAAVPAA